jgi:hypothetical protein
MATAPAPRRGVGEGTIMGRVEALEEAVSALLIAQVGGIQQDRQTNSGTGRLKGRLKAQEVWATEGIGPSCGWTMSEVHACPKIV